MTKEAERVMALTGIIIAFASVGQLIFYFIRDYIRTETRYIFEIFLALLIVTLILLGIWAIHHFRRLL